jgi:hypothetical protein
LTSIGFLERIRILPKGYTKICQIMADCVPCVAEAGEIGIFTPMYVYVWQKPEKTA